MADAERNLISRVLFSEDIRPIVDRKLHEGMFVSEENKKVFSFITNYYRKYGVLPTMELMEDHFPTYNIKFVKEPADYWIDRIIETYVRNVGSDILLSNSKLLVENPMQGLEALKENFLKLNMEANPTEDVNYIESIDARKESYLKLKGFKGIDGLPTPWEILNEITMGIHEEDFVVIVARPKIGKSWLLCILAQFLWENNLNCLFVTNEMSTQQIQRRIDAVTFKLPYNEFRAGLLPDHIEKRYLDGLEALKGSDCSPIYVINNIGGVSAISAKIDEYKPDIVLVDGMYLLPDDRRGGNKWERTSNISYDLKQLCKKKKIPTIATTQFNRTADESVTKMTQVNLSMLGFSDSIGQDADLVLGLFTNKDMQLNQELMVRVLAIREGEPKDFVLNWNLREMDFSLLSAEDDTKVIDDGEMDVGDINY